MFVKLIILCCKISKDHVSKSHFVDGWEYLVVFLACQTLRSFFMCPLYANYKKGFCLPSCQLLSNPGFLFWACNKDNMYINYLACKLQRTATNNKSNEATTH